MNNIVLEKFKNYFTRMDLYNDTFDSLRQVWRLTTAWISILISLIFFSCKNDDKPSSMEFNFDFQADAEGWIGDFADYPNDPDVENFYELEFSYSTLPNPLNTNDGALRQSGKNHSDDLFMFVKKKISGLKPGTNYAVSIEIEIASDAPSGIFGVGGAPGESVYIKAGASNIEPMKVLDDSDNHFRMNIDKGNQSQDGSDMRVIGDFANGTELNEYVLKTLATENPITVQTNSNGEIWAIVGTDSGFEARTTIYYNSIKIVLD